MHAPAVRRTPPARLAALALCGLVFATGCAHASRKPLTKTAQQKAGATQVVAVLNQEEIGVYTPPATGGAMYGGGLLGAIIESAVQNSQVKDAEASARPIRDALLGAEPRKALESSLQQAVASGPWVTAGPVVVRKLEPSQAALKAMLAEGPGTSVLLVTVDYRLRQGNSGLVATAQVKLYPRAPPTPPPAKQKSVYDAREAEEKPKEIADPLYENTFVVSVGFPGFTPETTPEQATSLWAAADPKVGKRAVEGAMGEIARMVAFDLAEGGPAGAADEAALYKAPAGAVERLSVGPYGVGQLGGFMVHEGEGRYWLRAAGGELVASGTLYP